MFRMTLLPAREGDCIVLEWGSQSRPHRMLVDGGKPGTQKHLGEYSASLPSNARPFSLVVVTHVDDDHIGGMLSYFPHVPPTAEFWFNGPEQLHDTPETPHQPSGGTAVRVGAIHQGNKLLNLLSGFDWNTSFQGGAVATWQEPVELDGGLRLTVLSPDQNAMLPLAEQWDAVNAAAGLQPGGVAVPRVGAAKPFVPPASIEDIRRLADPNGFAEDDSPANASSIALLAEYRGKRLLLSGDAHPSVLAKSLATIAREDGHAGPVAIDLAKLPHHGSDANVSPELLDAIDCRRFAISTSGSTFHHPDAACIARLVTHRTGVELIFNYRSQMASCWDETAWMREFGYTATYPPATHDGWATIDV